MEGRVPGGVILAVCAILVATASAAALRSLALAADGSYYLVRILGTPGVFGPESRTLVNAVRQAPLLLAGWLGVDATSSLAVVQGLGQLVLPALVWCLAVVVARHEAPVFVAVSTTGALCLGATLFFNVSESLLAVALTASVAVLLWQPRVWRGTDMALAVAASSVLVASYESTALTGVLLAGWAAWRALSASGAERYAAALVAALSALSVAVAYSGTATETGSISARSSLYSIVSFEPAEFYVALLAVAALVGVWVRPARAPDPRGDRPRGRGPRLLDRLTAPGHPAVLVPGPRRRSLCRPGSDALPRHPLGEPQATGDAQLDAERRPLGRRRPGRARGRHGRLDLRGSGPLVS